MSSHPTGTRAPAAGVLKFGPTRLIAAACLIAAGAIVFSERANASVLTLIALVLLAAGYALVHRLLGEQARKEQGLREAAEALEQRVRERTAEIEKASVELKRSHDEMQRFAAAHKASEDKFRAYVEQAADALFVHDSSGDFIAVNERACTSLGYSREELLRLNVIDVETDFDLPRAQDVWRQIRPGQRFILEGHHRRKDGSTFPVEVHFGCFELNGERQFLGLVRDVTERKLAERTHAELAAIVESSIDAIISVSRAGLVLTWNQGAQQLLGYSAQEIVGHPVTTIYPPDRQWEIREFVEQRLNRGEKVPPYETVRRHKDGRLIPVAISMSPVRDAAGGVVARSSIVRDISERKRLEAELLRVSDYEQRRLGHDLHDGVGQQLTAIELMLHQLAVQAAGETRVTAPVEKIAAHLRTAIREVRMLARGLAPFILDSTGLQAALAGLVGNAQAGSTRCALVCPAPIRSLDNETATQLYRIAQEAFNNALKYSGASTIEIRLLQRDGALELDVVDDGCGLPAQVGAATGMGLQIMRYRAGLIGSNFALHSQPGRGVAVCCTLPSHP